AAPAGPPLGALARPAVRPVRRPAPVPRRVALRQPRLLVAPAGLRAPRRPRPRRTVGWPARRRAAGLRAVPAPPRLPGDHRPLRGRLRAGAGLPLPHGPHGVLAAPRRAPRSVAGAVGLGQGVRPGAGAAGPGRGRAGAPLGAVPRGGSRLARP